jgi:hypothetical protein
MTAPGGSESVVERVARAPYIVGAYVHKATAGGEARGFRSGVVMAGSKEEAVGAWALRIQRDDPDFNIGTIDATLMARDLIEQIAALARTGDA